MLEQLSKRTLSDIDRAVRPGQHRKQAQQQHLGERIHHFVALPRIRQVLEIEQKTRRFANCRKARRRLVHRVLRYPNQRITTDSAIYSVDTTPFATSPLLLHPIALAKGLEEGAIRSDAWYIGDS